MQLTDIPRIVLSTLWISLVLLVQATWSQTMDMETTQADFSTVSTSTTPEPTPGPNDLVLVDWIIITVTCCAALGIMIGGSVYAYKASKASKLEKNEIYSRYLDRDELAGIKDGVENESYDAGY